MSIFAAFVWILCTVCLAPVVATIIARDGGDRE